MQRARTDHKCVLGYAHRHVADLRRYARSIKQCLRFALAGEPMTRMLSILVAFAAAPAFGGGPTVIRVTPATAPRYVLIEVTGNDCGTKRLDPGYEPIWYATAKARLSDLDGRAAAVAVQLRDPTNDALLLNPETRSWLEGGYVGASIAFNPKILDQIVFQWGEEDKIYAMYLRDFYSGERC
jgi:hypothetical protein